MSRVHALEAIRAALEAAFSPRLLSLTDDSHHHRGHAGVNSDTIHLSLSISATSLDSLSRLAQHRAIYACLAAWMPQPLHALSITVKPTSAC